MKLICSFLLLLSLNALAQLKQYPEERTYTAQDRGMAPYLSRSLYGTGKFALTFDDGPHAQNTPRLLDLLKQHEVKVTFFVITELITDAMLPLLKRMLDEGHILASHNLIHAHSNELDEATFKSYLRRSILTLKRVYEYAGHPWTSIYFRYPYGQYGGATGYHHMNALREVSRELFRDNCIQFVFWDVDTADWVKSMTAEDVFANIKAHHQGGRYYDFKLQDGQYVKVPKTMTTPPRGGVVLQHDVHEKNIEATGLFIEWAKQNGVELVTLPEVDEFAVQRECRFIN